MGAGLNSTYLRLPDLWPILARRWLVVGIGNALRGDDAFGPALARSLRSAALPAIDAGVSPESVLGRILAAAPEVLILADCADHGERAGAVALLPPSCIGNSGPSTHDPGLGLFLYYLRNRSPGLETWLLVAQPGNLGLGAAMSAEVREAVRDLAGAFRRAARSQRAVRPRWARA